MDPILAFIMSNMAHVKKHDLIFDPFVGTGSLLVGAAHYGAHVLGADLDYNVIHSKGILF
jgi:tRNA (guanine10-N2)-methyltransferase